MALAINLPTLDGVDDVIKALYIPVPASEGTGFKLDLDGYEDPTALKLTLDKVRTESKDATKALRETLKKYEGMPDPEKLKIIMSQLENDEEMKLLAEGKLPEVVKMKTEKLRQDLQRVADEANTKAQKAEEKASKFEMQVLRGQLSTAAITEGVNIHPSAIKYIFTVAKEDGWGLDENGNARQFDKTGEIVLGKDGKTPYTFQEWLKDPKTVEDNPTWYLNPNSGGGGGGNTNKSGSKIDTSKMTAAQKLTAARDRKNSS